MRINNYSLSNSDKARKQASVFKKLALFLLIVTGSANTAFSQIPAPVASAATNITCTSVDANWGSVPGATNYYIDVSTNLNFSSFFGAYNNLNIGNVLTYNITGLSTNVDYFYRIRAFDGTYTSLNSNTILANTGLSTSTSALSATNITCTSFNANWNAVPGATAYYLDVSTSPGFATFVSGYNNLNAGTTTTFSITGLSANMFYYYRIRASNGCTTSINSNTVSTLTGSPVAPVALANSNFTCTSTNANWNAVAGASQYFIDLSTDSGFSSFVGTYNNLNTGNVTTYNLTGLSANTTYYYRVRAANSCATSLNSNTISFNTNTSLTIPTVVSATNTTCASADANWNMVSDANSYILDVATDPAFANFVAGYNGLNVGNVTTHTITGLTANTTYYYRVRSSNGCGNSANSNSILITTSSTTNPVAPAALAANNLNCTSFTANWSAVPGATNYYLDVSTTSSFSTFLTGYNNLSVGNLLSYNITGLTAYMTYYYRLRAMDGCGTSTNSSTITTSTSGADAPVAFSPAFISCTSFDANWNASTGALGYYIDVSSDQAFATFIGIYNNLNIGNVTTYNVSGLIANTTYYYRTRVINSCGTSASSNVIVAGTTAPDAPIATNGTNTSCTSFNANWAASAGAIAYFLDVSTSSAFSTFVTGYNNLNINNTTTLNITGLALNTTYYYRVRAANGCSTSSNSNTITSSTSSAATLSSTLTPPAVCSGSMFNYTPTSSSPGATFAWARPAVAGITNLTGSGSGDPNEALVNTTTTAVNVEYIYTISANGCTNPTTFSVNVSVNPMPALSSTLSPPAICSGSAFSYIPTSSTSGAAFSWTRAVVSGISNAAGSGTGNPNETLTNTTIAPVNVSYVYTLSANGCANTTTYSVVVTVNPAPTLSSSLTPPAIFTNHIFSYTPTSATSGASFAWVRAALTGISNSAGSGTDDPNEALFNTTTAPVNVTYVYTVSANGCANPTSYNVVVTVNTAAVWPGDANNDSLVNNIDLLALGLYYSQTGTPRSSIDNTFQAYVATNWLTLQSNGQDIKHADSNGDGTINADDTLAINLNYNLTHTIVAPPSDNYYQERATSDMYFVINSSAFSAGDWVNIELWLGTQTAPVNNLYGIAFDIDYESVFAQTGTETIIYPASWLGTSGTDALTINKIDALANTAHGAITRTDHIGRSGYGKIADFKFQVKNTLSSDDTMHFSISTYMAVDSSGGNKTLTTGTDSIAVNAITTGIKNKEKEPSVTISPNPFNVNTTISLSTEIKNGTATIIDMLGKEVKTVNFSGKQMALEKGELNSGIYSVKITTEQKTIIAIEKIIIR